jgi:hypothetical protein
LTERKIPDASRIAPGIALEPSKLGGCGLFARRPFRTGETLLVWGGPSYTDAAGARRARAQGRGTMQWDEDLFSVATEPLEGAFRINHSCDPNVWMDGAFTLTARRDISAGEELLVDYATMLDEETYRSPCRCRCGSPLCRGRVTGSDWKLPALRKAYLDHFSPLIEKRIARDERVDIGGAVQLDDS